MSPDHKEVIDFLFNHRTKYLFPNWSWEQIATYMLSYFTFNQVRRVKKQNGLLAGVIVFEEVSGETLHIIHFATDKNPDTFRTFLEMLNFEYPYVKYLLSIRKLTKQVLFQVDKLNLRYFKHLATF